MVMRRSTRSTFSCLALVCLLAGCAWRSYAPLPLDLTDSERIHLSRRLTDDRVRDTLKAHSLDIDQWPSIRWSREKLMHALWVIHPDQKVALAEWSHAMAATKAGLQTSPPEINTTLEHHSQTSSGLSSPWAVGAGLQWEWLDPSVKKAMTDVAGVKAEATKLSLGETTWRLYQAMGQALLERQICLARQELVQQGLELAVARQSSVQVRERFGVATALEIQSTAQRLSEARREAAELEAACVLAQSQLAEALSVPLDALTDIQWEDWPVFVLPTAEEARRTALTHRLDLARQRADYQLTETELQFEVAKQYPSLRLGPGVLWSQGDAIWQFSLALPSALLNRNHAAIDVATAKRNAQAQRVYAKQSDIISEVERLRLQSVSLIKPLALAEAAKHEATEQLNLLKAQFEAGQIDTLTLIEGKQQLLLASRSVLEAQSALQRSSWALEQSMQKPLPLAKPNE